MKKLLVIMALLWGGGALGVWYWNDINTRHVVYRTAAVKRGDLHSTINATGTIEPEEVVDVGAQVAGEIQSFGADPRDPARPISYGSPVEQGTVLAQLDRSLFKARVNQTQASLEKARADVEQAEARLRQAERDLDRQRKLRAKGQGMVATADLDKAQAEYETSQAALSVAKGSVGIAEANLEEAKVNLGYTTIKSPVKGVILDRRVNIGQTVVASLNAPSLFLIAKDLSRLEIWASVNETDIGSIHVGQNVHFTVGAFPDQSFQGKVAQIRLNASMVQSVVTYTVVVAVDNADGKLLPYLTARIQFKVRESKDVLLVPNAALRWQPRAEHVVLNDRAEFVQSQRSRTRGNADDSPTGGSGAKGILWVKSGDFVRPLHVRVGLTDGVTTEVGGAGLKEGAEVVVGVDRHDEADEVYSILPHTKTEKTKSSKQ